MAYRIFSYFFLIILLSSISKYTNAQNIYPQGFAIEEELATDFMSNSLEGAKRSVFVISIHPKNINYYSFFKCNAINFEDIFDVKNCIHLFEKKFFIISDLIKLDKNISSMLYHQKIQNDAYGFLAGFVAGAAITYYAGPYLLTGGSVEVLKFTGGLLLLGSSIGADIYTEKTVVSFLNESIDFSKTSTNISNPENESENALIISLSNISTDQFIENFKNALNGKSLYRDLKIKHTPTGECINCYRIESQNVFQSISENFLD